ncbi:sushi, von Willebrand factor type A, EGF and pentraxin domain-containing protein 1-like isoform X1 [Mercenaria mercenaria]|uniref:sushi, von Willebrand factor type A, EGF and pentraxin domain-containing protein 1-like isoform X1 n=1 Tax=Mercenaria mercenaria TaxID=6596 RepID=UPI00234ED134|nr:sushi, von Willebrand factor type A, EGF and pentraxin domain-containing protein 1-like isoform X1 [Mercenaria mercenaria]XP_053375971.1 sushi, von Willebrand factor type A, EGF and pentraxin domain-containing protein 1-like isoform X1 [Mercenaria mercenaria]XP_053375972.1 sushi, von Willebrand factor type A, EGF and pentraxin domain-containing protein 1-like isoform X1 [Mercenaria mercenaria]XP_053375973.1 sushi, von Willebrand factor type A, EGF and pentraxin domain-containing protein 1-lik
MRTLKLIYDAFLSIACLVSCIKADCDSPPSISNAVNNITGSPPYSEDTTTRYDCDLGFNPAGTSRYYTCSNSVWIDGNFRCEQIYCSHVEPPENSQIVDTPTNEVGTVIQFACDEGYDMSGQSTMTCRTDGNWLPSVPPTCIAKDCGEFGSIQYADTFQDNSEVERNRYGSVVEVTCQNGRVLTGPPRVKCGANGQWGVRPTCEILQCPAYPNINSSCIKAAELSGDFYFILCKEGVSTRAGPDAAECVSGEWDSTEMACLCDCVIPEYDSSLLTISNLNSFGNLPHVTALEWTCNGGSSTSSIDNVVCIDGKLRAEKDGQEIIISNFSNPSDINRIIMSEICVLPTTESSTTTTSISPSVSSTSPITQSSANDVESSSKASNGKSLTTTIKPDRNRINSGTVGLNYQLCFCIFCICRLLTKLT